MENRGGNGCRRPINCSVACDIFGDTFFSETPGFPGFFSFLVRHPCDTHPFMDAVMQPESKGVEVMPQRTKLPQRPEDCATAWFAVLERARIDGDASREEQAKRELARLGIRVEWERAYR